MGFIRSLYGVTLVVLVGSPMLHSQIAVDLEWNGDDDQRSDVITNLNLSPWELFVLSDLVFKVSSAQCPKLKQEVLKSLQKDLQESFKQAPRTEVQNEEFLPAYSKLVRCVDHLRVEKHPDPTPETAEGYPKKSVEVDKVKAGNAKSTVEDDSEESDWIAKEATTTTTTEAPVQVPKGSGPFGFSQWFSGIKSLEHWVTDLFRSKRDVTQQMNADSQKQIEKNIEDQRKARRLRLYKRGRQSFADFFHGMSKVVGKTCPKIYRPDKVFLRKALLDMTTWATLDQHDTVTAAAQYFHRYQLLSVILDCQQG